MNRFRVEPLPARPNLEQQQKLAKRLLRDAWNGDAEAIERIQAFVPAATDPEQLKLHDAQMAIARGYGFQTWAEMKHKIESLTQTTAEQFDAAVRTGDAARLRELLAKHGELRRRINEPRFDFDSPAIHQAKKHLDVVDVLLEYGADINARSNFWAGSFGILEWNLTPEEAAPLIARGAVVTVWAAAGLGLIEDLRRILRENPAAVRERGGDGKTALHCATTPAIAELLISHGADLEARDNDHGATALQYLIGDEAIVRLLVARGAQPDLYVAARLGDVALVRDVLLREPESAGARLGHPPFVAPGGHIYNWSLGVGTPVEAARKYGHEQAAQLILAQAPVRVRFLHALWDADEPEARRALASQPGLMQELAPHEHALMAEAAWDHRIDAVRLMLDLGFDPHVPTVHRSTPLDRASFHGYADIVALLLQRDAKPPMDFQNEFGGTPLGACLYGATQGWKTGHPQDHLHTAQLLLEAGSSIDPTWLPTGNDAVDLVLRQWLKQQGGKA